MPYTLKVDGSDVSTTLFAPGSVGGGLRGEQTESGTDKLEFALKQVGSGTITPSVDVGDPVLLTEDTTGDKLFGGFVHSVETEEVTNLAGASGTVLMHRVVAIDNTRLAWQRIVNEVYSSTAFETVVDSIVTNFMTGDGIDSTTYVDAGPTIQKARFSWRYVGDALDEICEQIGYAWWIDADKNLHCHERSTNTSAFSLSASSRDFQKLKVRRSLEAYANKIVLPGGKGTTSSQTESFVGDGTRQTFSVGFPVATKPTIEINSVAVSGSAVGTRGLDTGKEWYWEKGSTEISQDVGETPLADTDTLDITYQGLYRIVVEAEDTAEIAARAAASTGTSGKYERLEVDASIDELQLASDKAQGILRRYGVVPKMIDLMTRDHRLRAGELASIVLPEYDLSGQFLIDSVSFAAEEDGELTFSATLLSGESLGGWQNFWRRVTRGERLVIGDEFIIKLQAITENLGITLTESATEISGDDRYLTFTDDDQGVYALKEYWP